MTSLSEQAWLFFLSVLTGAGIGLYYDAFRILRKTAPFFAKNAVAVQDTLFWLVATGGMFYFLLHENFGEIRMFAVMGAVLGAVLYFAALSRLIIVTFVAVIEFLKKVITAALKIIFAPLIWVYKYLKPKLRAGLYSLARYGKMKLKNLCRNWFIFRKKV
ncbi:MAG: spore cortex biosynthesis protein YabQ [Defluviitaleaceae bacterium]|nr:spore cortex biosynthesis protein YabQ [Defluviitaleaceae bacterium]